VHSTEDWDQLLLPEIEYRQELGMEVVFRADAAFAKPEIYNLSNLRRRPALPRRIENWSLTIADELQQRLVKTGGRL